MAGKSLEIRDDYGLGILRGSLLNEHWKWIGFHDGTSSMANVEDTGKLTARGASFNPGTPSAAFVDLAIRLALLGVLAYWSLLLIRPFLTIALWSVVLAVALFPLYDWLADRLGGRRSIAAIFITALNLLIVLGPVTWLGLALVENLRALSERFIAGDLSIPPPFEAIKSWPLIGEPAFELWTLASSNLGAAFTKIAPQFKQVGGILLGVAATGGVGMLTFLASVIVSGFLFVPGPSLITAVKTLSNRVDSKHGAAFIQLAGATIRNVSRGVVGISLLQALLGGGGTFRRPHHFCRLAIRHHSDWSNDHFGSRDRLGLDRHGYNDGDCFHGLYGARQSIGQHSTSPSPVARDHNSDARPFCGYDWRDHRARHNRNFCRADRARCCVATRCCLDPE